MLLYLYIDIDYNEKTQISINISPNNENKEKNINEIKYGEIIDMTNQNLKVFNNSIYNIRNIKKLRL